MVHSVSGWTRGDQVKLWNLLKTRAIPERLRGVFTTRRYANSRLPLPYALSNKHKMNIVRCPYVPKGGSNTKRHFPSKIALYWKKVCYKVFCVNTVSDSVVRHIYPCKNGSRVMSPITWKFGRNWPTPSQTPISNQHSFVAPQPWQLAKTVKLTQIGSLLRAFQWVWDEQCTLRLSHEREAQNRKVSKIWTIICNNLTSVRARMSASINH